MYKRYIFYFVVFSALIMLFFGPEVIDFVTGDPIRDIQGWADDAKRAFGRFISG